MKKLDFLILSLIVIFVFLIGISIGIKLTLQKAAETEKFGQIINLDRGRRMVTLPIVGVDDNYNGVVAELIAELKEGNGQVLVNINNILADYNIQYSARIAAKVASDYTKINLSNYDITYSIKTNASLIGGSSAGSVLAVAAIALLEDRTINNSIAMTGAIDENGNLLPVSAIPQKAKAASTVANLFLTSYNSIIEDIEHEEIKECGLYQNMEYCKIYYKQKEINKIGDINIEIKRVKNIGEAMGYFYNEN